VADPPYRKTEAVARSTPTSTSFFCEFLRPGVFQGDGAIEHELAGRAVLIEREVGEALELVAQLGFLPLSGWARIWR